MDKWQKLMVSMLIFIMAKGDTSASLKYMEILSQDTHTKGAKETCKCSVCATDR
jgi:hypothetical protein